jgi:hypothetical protein
MERSVIIKSTPKVRTALVLFLLLMLIVAMVSCESAESKELKAERKFSGKNENERFQLIKELEQLEVRIDRELKRVEENLFVVDQRDRNELFYTDRKLKSSRAKVEKALRDIRECDEANWEQIKSATIRSKGEITASFDQIAFQFQNLLNGE